jgi:hypothetical protein
LIELEILRLMTPATTSASTPMSMSRFRFMTTP